MIAVLQTPAVRIVSANQSGELREIAGGLGKLHCEMRRPLQGSGNIHNKGYNGILGGNSGNIRPQGMQRSICTKQRICRNFGGYVILSTTPALKLPAYPVWKIGEIGDFAIYRC